MTVCRWCGCDGYHSEFCEGFAVNDPAARVAARTVREMRSLYRTRCVIPAVWVKRQPTMDPLVRVDRRYGSVQIQWRLPKSKSLRARGEGASSGELGRKLARLLPPQR